MRTPTPLPSRLNPGLVVVLRPDGTRRPAHPLGPNTFRDADTKERFTAPFHRVVEPTPEEVDLDDARTVMRS